MLGPSETGEQLSPKMAPHQMAPRVIFISTPMTLAMAYRAMPRVPTVVREEPQAMEMIMHASKAVR